MFGVVICPMVFYIPKFFELKTVYSPYSIRTVVDCASIIEPAGDLRGEYRAHPARARVPSFVMFCRAFLKCSTGPAAPALGLILQLGSFHL